MTQIDRTKLATEAKHNQHRRTRMQNELETWKARALDAESEIACIVQAWQTSHLAQCVNDARQVIEAQGWRECSNGHWEHPGDGPCIQCGEDDDWTPTPEEIAAEMDRLESIPHPSQTLSSFIR